MAKLKAIKMMFVGFRKVEGKNVVTKWYRNGKLARVTKKPTKPVIIEIKTQSNEK